MARGSSRLWWYAAIPQLVLGCGGSAVINPDSSGASAAGGSAAGGASGMNGGASAGGAGSCAYGGKTYANGARFPASDGCNTCSCQTGLVGCSLLACTTGCQSDGQSYQPGETFKLDCNTCACQADGTISCTNIACENQCAALRDKYAAALKRAKTCNPGQPDQCTTVAAENLACGCSTPVNANNVDALKDLSVLAQQAEGQCIIPPCEPCVQPPGPTTCTNAGSCEIAPFRSGEAACKVGGIVYAHGTEGILDPGSCNKCRCEDGVLACTEIGCPRESCPTGTVLGSQCAECGPTDACQIVEYACLPSCSGACAGLCLDGVCRQVCG